MTNRFFVSICVGAIIAAGTLAPLPAASQSAKAVAKKASQPRTSWGHPDLQGYWTAFDDILTPLERTCSFPGDPLCAGGQARVAQSEEEALRIADERGGATGAGPKVWYETRPSSGRTSLIVDPPDGALPPRTPWAEERRAALSARSNAAESAASLSPGTRCITRGPGSIFPNGFMYNTAILILQSRDLVTIHLEMFDTRVIPLDGRPHVPPAIRSFMGDSRGHWEGETLVVDVTNYTDETNGLGGVASDALHVTERFTRVDANTLNYEMTVEDPKVFTRPWKASIPLKRDDNYRMFEYACHEGNYGIENILSGARASEAKAAKKERP